MPRVVRDRPVAIDVGFALDALRRHLEGAAGVGLGDQRVAVFEALRGAAEHIIPLNLLDPAYPAIYRMVSGSAVLTGLVRFLLAFLLVMAPTVLMGATLPALTRYLVRRDSPIGVELSTLYAVNTLGAVTGVLLTGFVLIRAWGIHPPVYLAVAGNLLIGCVAWLASRYVVARKSEDGAVQGQEKAPVSSEIPAGVRRLVLFGLCLSGFTSFAYEIFWTRSLVFVLGNSVYALSTMLSAFLTGIALGGWLARWIDTPSISDVVAFTILFVSTVVLGGLAYYVHTESGWRMVDHLLTILH